VNVIFLLHVPVVEVPVNDGFHLLARDEDFEQSLGSGFIRMSVQSLRPPLALLVAQRAGRDVGFVERVEQKPVGFGRFDDGNIIISRRGAKSAKGF